MSSRHQLSGRNARGKLARRWPLWVAASLVFFIVATAITIAAFTSWGGSPALAIGMDAGFVFSSAASCFAFLSMFVRFVQARSPVWDRLAANSYGIYLIHYAVVSWMQYELVPAALPAIAKWFIVFPGSLMLSWALADTIRRIPAVARVI
ncbi:MAG: acyltransferase family protein [Acidobacteriaceae bacterium]